MVFFYYTPVLQMYPTATKIKGPDVMIDLYTWPTPNGHKLHIMLEETGLDYTVHAVNIGEGEQFDPFFLKISPNNRIPAMVDSDGPDGEPYSLFESGAMLIYLAEKTGMFLPAEPAQRYKTLQWLMFQMGGVGPMFGQSNHFINYAPEKIPYAMERYQKECERLYNVMEKQLGQEEYLAGDYSIADIATYPWAMNWKRREINLEDFSNLKRWLDAIAVRPAVEKGMAVLAEKRRKDGITDKEREILFGKTQFEKR